MLGQFFLFLFQEGWSETVEYLQRIWTEEGPFDGILGFSQGRMGMGNSKEDEENFVVFRLIFPTETGCRVVPFLP